MSQKLQIRVDHLKTLNDFQKLLGNINWIRPYLKLTTGELSPLFNILHGDANPKSPQQLTPEAKIALQLVKQKLNLAKVKQVNYGLPWQLIILQTEFTPNRMFVAKWSVRMDSSSSCSIKNDFLLCLFTYLHYN